MGVTPDYNDDINNITKAQPSGSFCQGVPSLESRNRTFSMIANNGNKTI